MKKRVNGSDAVRGVGPLRMIRREVNSTAPAAGLGTGWVRNSSGHQGATEVVGNTVTTTSLLWHSSILVPGHRENLMPPHHSAITLDCPTC